MIRGMLVKDKEWSWFNKKENENELSFEDMEEIKKMQEILNRPN